MCWRLGRRATRRCGVGVAARGRGGGGSADAHVGGRGCGHGPQGGSSRVCWVEVPSSWGVLKPFRLQSCSHGLEAGQCSSGLPTPDMCAQAAAPATHRNPTQPSHACAISPPVPAPGQACAIHHSAAPCMLPCMVACTSHCQPGASLHMRAQVRASGLVVNSMGWIVELGYELLKHTVQASGQKEGGQHFSCCLNWPVLACVGIGVLWLAAARSPWAGPDACVLSHTT